MYGAPFVSKFFLKDYESGTNQMGGFVGGAPFLQMADSEVDSEVDSLILLFVFHDLSIKSISWNYNYDGVNVRAEPKE